MPSSTGIYRILVGDNEPMVTRFLKEALSQAGHFVDVAQTGEDAKAKLESAEFGILILDLGLSNHSGLQILQDLRRRGRRTGVILTSTGPSEEAHKACEEYQRVQFLQKPFGLMELRIALERVSNVVKC